MAKWKHIKHVLRIENWMMQVFNNILARGFPERGLVKSHFLSQVFGVTSWSQNSQLSGIPYLFCPLGISVHV